MYQEHIKKGHFNEVLYKLKWHNTLGLEGKFRIKFERNIKFLFKYISLCVDIGQLAFVFIFIILTTMLIYQQASLSYTITTILWFGPSILLIKSAGSLMLTSFYFIYLIALYLKLRFHQLFYSLKISLNLGKLI